MHPTPIRSALALGLSALALALTPAPAAAQDDEAVKARVRDILKKAQEEYRTFFQEPKTVPQFWAALTFEIDVGKFDIAAYHLDRLLRLPETTKQTPDPKDDVTEKQLVDDLLEIEESEGLSAFLRLQAVPRWDKNDTLQEAAEANVARLIELVRAGLQARLRDGERIGKYIRLLEAPTREERAYAFAQLNRSGEYAAPYLVDALVATAGTPQHERLKGIILKLRPEVIPPMLEVLKAQGPEDYREVDLRHTVLGLFRATDNTDAVPYLWHMMASAKYPDFIRSQARRALASLLRMDERDLPDPRVKLTQLATHFYDHDMRFRNTVADPKSDSYKVKLWRWNGKQLERQPSELTPWQAEYLFGTRYAQEALDLEPAYRPAQQVLLGLMLEHTVTPRLPQFLNPDPKAPHPLPPDLQSLLATVDANLLMETLEKALDEHNTAVALPLVWSLRKRLETRAALPTNNGIARSLTRALFYPDRRVQVEAVRAMIEMPGEERAAVVPPRVVRMLARFLTVNPGRRALAVGFPEDKGAGLRQALGQAGFEAVLVPNRQVAFATVRDSADFDLIVLDGTTPKSDLNYMLSKLRADVDLGRLPVVVLAPGAGHAALERLARPYANVFVALDALVAVPDRLAEVLDRAVLMSMTPDSVRSASARQQDWLEGEVYKKGLAFSDEERKAMPYEAMDILLRMAEGDLRGYDIAPAKDAIFTATRSADAGLAEMAISAYATIPGTEVQQRLAEIALDKGRDPQLRWVAAQKLKRHIAENGFVLNSQQIDRLKEAFRAEPDASPLKVEFAAIFGQMGSTNRVSGLRLRDFPPPTPQVPQPQPQPQPQQPPAGQLP